MSDRVSDERQSQRWATESAMSNQVGDREQTMSFGDGCATSCREQTGGVAEKKFQAKFQLGVLLERGEVSNDIFQR